MWYRARIAVLLVAGLLISLRPTAAQESELGKLSPEVLSKEERSEARGMIDRDIQRRTKAFNDQHRATWYAIKTREQWEKYRDERIERLRKSLADWPVPAKPNVRVTGVVKGDGFNIENVVYETRPGLWVTGNLYVPAKPTDSMPGILIAHAHHGGKRDSELQDMGMLWARAGCLVLVIDQVGYGERRSHPFHRDTDFPKPFRQSRQDYYFRYDTGVQLQLLGDSLMGWMAWDLMRGVDLLLARDGVDAKRIAILGAVAGGGDPAGVTAALDPRIACCVPFNFGGPQPETKYPLPNDAETSFNYLLFTYWDSTRGLRLGASGDFPHWVITSSIAPRHLIHGHEFSWDGERDPVWKRYQKVWGEFYNAGDRVGVAHGKGLLKLRPPEASHCNNIGEFHRRMIHPLFERWLGIKASEYHAPRSSSELICLTEEVVKKVAPKSLNQVMNETAAARVERARAKRASMSPEERKQSLRAEWRKLLGPIEPAKPATAKKVEGGDTAVGGAKIERLVLEVEPGIVVPTLVLLPNKRGDKSPVVIAAAQGGKAGFLKDRAAEVQKLVDAGTIVVLPDLRGTGETQSGTSRGRDSSGTDQSVHVQLFGETLLGQRLRDLRSVIGYLRTRAEIDAERIALWGDSFAATNSEGTSFRIPHGVDGWPHISEPLGQLLGLLGALYEDDVRAVFISGGLTGYQGVLTHFAVLVPHDACVPGALTTGDLCDLAAAVAPRPLCLTSMVDAMNRPVPTDDVKKAYAPAIQGYAKQADALTFSDKRSSAAAWLIEELK